MRAFLSSGIACKIYLFTILVFAFFLERKWRCMCQPCVLFICLRVFLLFNESLFRFFDEKMPFDYDWFCPLKTMAFMVIKGNIICWYFLKALPSADTTPLYSEGNNSIFLRRSFFPYNLRAFHTTVQARK